MEVVKAMCRRSTMNGLKLAINDKKIANREAEEFELLSKVMSRVLQSLKFSYKLDSNLLVSRKDVDNFKT